MYEHIYVLFSRVFFLYLHPIGNLWRYVMEIFLKKFIIIAKEQVSDHLNVYIL